MTVSEETPPDWYEDNLETSLSKLITANHILHNLKISDSYSHISVRSPDNDDAFFISHNVSPALVSSRSDLLEFSVKDGSPVDKDSQIGWSERYGHSEIYKRFPAVNCVVHSRSADVLPYTVCNVPLKPLTHMAGFLGSELPVWDIQTAYSSGPGYVPSFRDNTEHHDLLIRNAQLGASLASAFANTASVAGSVYSSISSRFTGTKEEQTIEPDRPVVLMRGHGMAVAAKSIEEAVYMAFYTQEAAKVQTTALATGTAFHGGVIDGSVDVAGDKASGKIKGGKVKLGGELKYLSTKEAKDTWEVHARSVGRPWRVWKREVDVNPMYVNKMSKT